MSHAKEECPFCGWEYGDHAEGCNGKDKMKEFLENISYDEVHGCCTGDCPHDHANDCLTDLIKLIKERAEEARKLLAP